MKSMKYHTQGDLWKNKNMSEYVKSVKEVK